MLRTGFEALHPVAQHRLMYTKIARRRRASARIICSCSTSSTFDESFRNTLPITMRRGRTFRSGRTRPADGQSNNSEILSRIQSLADYTIDTLESSFQKRQRQEDLPAELEGAE